ADRSAGDDEVDGLRAFALFVGLDIETDALAFIERLQARALDRGDVHEHIAAAVIRLDESIAALTIEELHCPLHRHRATPCPSVASPPTPGTAVGPKHPHGQRASAARPQSLRRPPLEAERLSQQHSDGTISVLLTCG